MKSIAIFLLLLSALVASKDIDVINDLNTQINGDDFILLEDGLKQFKEFEFGVLKKNSTIAGINLKAGSRIWIAQGFKSYLGAGVLLKDTKIENVTYAAGTEIGFDDYGRMVSHGYLAEDTKINGVLYRKYFKDKYKYRNEIRYYTNHIVTCGTLAREQDISAWTFVADSTLVLYENGKARQGVINQECCKLDKGGSIRSKNINHIYLAGYDGMEYDISFYPSGKIKTYYVGQSCPKINEIDIPTNSYITLYESGKLKAITLLNPATINGKQYFPQAGEEGYEEAIKFSESGQMLMNDK